MRNTSVCVFFFMLTTVLISAVVSPQSGASCDQSEVYRESLKELFPHVSLSQRAHLQSYLEYGSDFFQNPPSTVSTHEYSVALSFWNELQECLRIANRNQRFTALHSWLQQKTIVPFRTLVPHTPLPGLISRLHAAYKKEEPYSWWSMLSFITKIAGGGALLTGVGYLVKYFFIQGIYDRCVFKSDLKPRYYSANPCPLERGKLTIIEAFINDHRYDIEPCIHERNRLIEKEDIIVQDVSFDARQLPPVGRVFIRKVLESYPAISPEAVQIIYILYKALNEHLLYHDAKEFVQIFASQHEIGKSILSFLTANYGDKRMSISLFRLLAQQAKNNLQNIQCLNEEQQKGIAIIDQIATTILSCFPFTPLCERVFTRFAQTMIEQVPSFNTTWMFKPVLSSGNSDVDNKVLLRTSINGLLKMEEVAWVSCNNECALFRDLLSQLVSASPERKKMLGSALLLFLNRRRLAFHKLIYAFNSSSFYKSSFFEERASLRDFLSIASRRSQLFSTDLKMHITQVMERICTRATFLNMHFLSDYYETLGEQDIRPQKIIKELPIGLTKKHLIPYLPLQENGILLEPDIDWDKNSTFVPFLLAQPLRSHAMDQLDKLNDAGRELFSSYLRNENANIHEWERIIGAWYNKEKVKSQLRSIQGVLKRAYYIQKLEKKLDKNENTLYSYVKNTIQYYFSRVFSLLIPLSIKTRDYLDENDDFQVSNWRNLQKKITQVAEAFSLRAIRHSSARYLIGDDTDFYRLLKTKYRVHFQSLGLRMTREQLLNESIEPYKQGWRWNKDNTNSFCFRPLPQWQCYEYFRTLKREILSCKAHRLTKVNIHLAIIRFFKKLTSVEYQDFVFRVCKVVLPIKSEQSDKQSYKDRKKRWSDACKCPENSRDVCEYLAWWQQNREWLKTAKNSVFYSESSDRYIPYKAIKEDFIYNEFVGRRCMYTAYHFLISLYETLLKRKRMMWGYWDKDLDKKMIGYKNWCLQLFNHEEPLEFLRSWRFWGKEYESLLPEGYKTNSQHFFNAFLKHENYIKEQYEWEEAFYDKTIDLYDSLLTQLHSYEAQHSNLLSMGEALRKAFNISRDLHSRSQDSFDRDLRMWNSLWGEDLYDVFTHYRKEGCFYVQLSQSLDIPLFSEQEVREEFIKACQDRLGLVKGYAACRALIESKGGGTHACGVIFDPEGAHADNPAFERDVHALYDFLYSAEGQDDSNEPADQHLVNVLQKFVRLCEYLWTMENLEPSSMPSLDEVVPPEQETYTDNQVYRVTPEETPATAAGGGGPHHA